MGVPRIRGVSARQKLGFGDAALTFAHKWILVQTLQVTSSRTLSGNGCAPNRLGYKRKLYLRLNFRFCLQGDYLVSYNLLLTQSCNLVWAAGQWVGTIAAHQLPELPKPKSTESRNRPDGSPCNAAGKDPINQPKAAADLQ